MDSEPRKCLRCGFRFYGNPPICFSCGASVPDSGENDPRVDMSSDEPTPMSERDQINAFSSELDRLVWRYGSEFQISYASLIGVLHMKATELTMQCLELEDDDEDESDE